MKTEEGSLQLDGYRTGKVASVNVSSGGVPKKATSGAQVAQSGVDGDAQRNRKFHGGPDRAVCLYSLERIQALKAEGHPIDVGTVGENVTLQGMDWNLAVPGAKVLIGGSVALEITSFTVPCKTIRGSFLDGRFTRISHKLHPGWSRVYARVLSEGPIERGDSVEIIPATG